MNEETTNASDNLDLAMFVDRLIEEKKFPESLEKEVIDQIKSDLLTRVEARMNAVLISNMPPDKLEEFNKLLDNNATDEEVQKFCGDSIPDLQQIMASELMVFKQKYLS
jgi:ATP phosphoribosyltransferase